MTRRRVWLLVALGVLATAGGLLLAVTEVEPVPRATDPGGFVQLVGLAGLAVAAWLAYDRVRGEASPEAVPWSEAGPIVEGTPEATPRRYPLTGGDLVEAAHEGAAVAREHRDVEAGVAVVRPLLREAYAEAVAVGGDDGASTEALDAGRWTDDRVAASVLSADVAPPTRTLRRRLRDWLYPGRAVARRVRRAVAALSATVDGTVPPVVGQSAPRRVPVHEPSLAARTVDADGAANVNADGEGRRPGGDGAAGRADGRGEPS